MSFNVRIRCLNSEDKRRGLGHKQPTNGISSSSITLCTSYFPPSIIFDKPFNGRRISLLR